jgi:cyd operon protein YbgT
MSSGAAATTEGTIGIMWYFIWALGLGLACSFAILNAMWFELTEDEPEPRA